MRKPRPKPTKLASEEQMGKEIGMIQEGEKLYRPDPLGYVSPSNTLYGAYTRIGT